MYISSSIYVLVENLFVDVKKFFFFFEKNIEVEKQIKKGFFIGGFRRKAKKMV